MITCISFTKNALVQLLAGGKRSKKSARGSSVVDQPEPTVLNDDSTFGQLVKEAGFVLMGGDYPNQLSE